MKKNFIKLFALTLAMSGAFANPVLAATDILFSPQGLQVQQGKTVAVNIMVNPAGVQNYTVKTELNFPADMLQVQSFTQSAGWMPLSQAGYDLIDNSKGILIKTAGYASGLTEQKSFGTVVFLAKKSGQAVINISANSMALDAEGKNVLKSSLAPAVVIINPIAPLAPKPSPSPNPVQNPSANASPNPSPEQSPEALPTGLGLTPAPQAESQTQAPVAGQGSNRSFMAGIANIVSLGTDNILVGLIALILLIAVLGFTAYKLRGKTKQKIQTELKSRS